MLKDCLDRPECQPHVVWLEMYQVDLIELGSDLCFAVTRVPFNLNPCLALCLQCQNLETSEQEIERVLRNQVSMV